MKLDQVNRGTAEQSVESLRQFAVNEIMANFPLAPFAEFYQMTGNADSLRKADSVIVAGDNRSIGNDYTAKSNTPGFANVALKIYGDKVMTDAAYERRGQDIGTQRGIDLANGSRAIGRMLMDATINDELSATKFSGIKQQATALGRNFVFDTENGGLLPTGNGNAEKKQQDKFIEALDAYLALIAGGADCIVANAYLMSRLTSLGRGLTSYTTVKGMYGRDERVDYYRDIPIVNAGYKSNNTGLVIGKDETVGTAEGICTSLYLLKFGEQTDVTFATNVGFDVKDLGIVGMNYVTAVEADLDLAILNANSILRFSGIIL